MAVSAKSLSERIEALPPEKQAEVEDFVEFLTRRMIPSVSARSQGTKRFPDDLLLRIKSRRERLFKEHGRFDTLTILRDLRENGPR
jgi:uncharacterized membrane-anchored protein